MINEVVNYLDQETVDTDDASAIPDRELPKPSSQIAYADRW